MSSNRSSLDHGRQKPFCQENVVTIYAVGRRKFELSHPQTALKNPLWIFGPQNLVGRFPQVPQADAHA